MRIRKMLISCIKLDHALYSINYGRMRKKTTIQYVTVSAKTWHITNFMIDQASNFLVINDSLTNPAVSRQPACVNSNYHPQQWAPHTVAMQLRQVEMKAYFTLVTMHVNSVSAYYMQARNQELGREIQNECQQSRQVQSR